MPSASEISTSVMPLALLFRPVTTRPCPLHQITSPTSKHFDVLSSRALKIPFFANREYVFVSHAFVSPKQYDTKVEHTFPK